MASLNLCSWGPGLESRLDRLTQRLRNDGHLENLSLLMVQEALAQGTSSSAESLADRLGWKVSFRQRRGDSEGLAFLYPPSTQVLKQSALHIETRHDASDYRRIAHSLQFYSPGFGKVRVVNNHLADRHEMALTRSAQLDETVRWLNHLENINHSDLVIMGGDFNTDPSLPFYRQEFEVLFRSYFGFMWTPVYGSDFSWVDFDSGIRELVDHFFVSRRTRRERSLETRTDISTFTTDERLSDHNFLTLRATLNPGRRSRTVIP